MGWVVLGWDVEGRGDRVSAEGQGLKTNPDNNNNKEDEEEERDGLGAPLFFFG